MPDGLLIDIGCGNGLVSLYVTMQRPNIDVLAIDIDYKICVKAISNVSRHGMKNRITVLNSDFFALNPPDAIAFCCNPPLIPGEVGFLYTKNGRETPFWIALLEYVRILPIKPIVYLHLFDFHGLENARTGSWPTLEEIAISNKYNIHWMYHGIRNIGATSKIRKHFQEIAKTFPRGPVIINGTQLSFSEAISNNYDLQSANIKIYQTIVSLH